MWHFLVSRLLSAALVSLGVMTLVFLLLHLTPGDPVEVMLGESAMPADREALRAALGLDQPLWQQWWNSLTGMLHGDFGQSLHSRRPILDLILERLPGTIWLALASLGIALCFAIPLGIQAAIHKGRWQDRTAMGFAMIGVSIPNVWMGPLLILFFSLWLGWLPVSGNEQFSSIILPALTLGTALAAVLSRMVRASLLDILNEDFIRSARARGVSEWQILRKHALPNAALPVLTVFGMQLGALLGGAVITETIFDWPGIGLLTVEAIQQRDYPVVQACVLLISVIYVLVNTLTDLLYGMIDPRIRLDDHT